MTTTRIKNWDVEWAEFFTLHGQGGPGIPYVRLVWDDGQSMVAFPLDSEEYTVDIINSGIFIRPERPSELHSIWDDIEGWSIDPDRFALAMKNFLSMYRDLRILGGQALPEFVEEEWTINPIPLVYDNGVEEFALGNDERTRVALNEKMNYVPLKDNPALTIKFRTKTGGKNMTGSDLQGAFLLLTEAAQLCFDAEDAVYTAHGVTPFEFLTHDTEPNVRDFFEDYITNNS